MIGRSRHFWCFVLCVGGLVALAPGAWASSDLRWSLRDAHPLIEDAQQLLLTADYPDERGVVQLRYLNRIEISKRQVVQTISHIYYYPTADSVQNNGSDSVSWNTHDETLTMLAAAAIGRDGSIHQFNPKTTQVVTDESTSVFTSRSTAVLQLPGLEEGGLSVLSYRITSSDVDNYFFSDWAQGGIRSGQRDFLITWTGEAPSWYADPKAFKCDESDGRVACRSRSGEPAVTDASVYYSDIQSAITVAAPNSWEDVVRDMSAKVSEAMSARGSLTPIVDELRGTDDRLERMLNLASREIRYVSFSEGEYAYQPHTVDETLTSKYGDCKDKSVLLVALLEALGENAYPVLVATSRENVSRLQVPSRAYFDHMVVCAQIDGGERCFDPTESHAGSANTPDWVQGRVRLKLVPGSTPDLMPKDKFVWRFDVNGRFRFLSDGGQQEELTRTYSSAYASWMRAKLGGLSAKKQAEWLQELHEDVVSEVKSPVFEVKGLEAYDEDLQVVTTANYTGISEPGEALVYLDGSYWIRSVINNWEIENEHYGLNSDGIRLTSRYEFLLNGLWKVQSVGADVDFESEFGRFTRRYEKQATRVVVTTEVEIASQWVPFDRIEDFNRFVELAVEETEIRFWGKPQPKS